MERVNVLIPRFDQKFLFINVEQKGLWLPWKRKENGETLQKAAVNIAKEVKIVFKHFPPQLHPSVSVPKF